MRICYNRKGHNLFLKNRDNIEDRYQAKISAAISLKLSPVTLQNILIKIIMKSNYNNKIAILSLRKIPCFNNQLISTQN